MSARDIQSAPAEFGAHEGLDLLLAQLDKYGFRATFAVPAVIAEIYPGRNQDAHRTRHEVAAHGFKHEDVSALSASRRKPASTSQRRS